MVALQKTCILKNEELTKKSDQNQKKKTTLWSQD
jgi:hypothetical protein